MKVRTIVAVAGIMLLIQGCVKTECDGYAPEGTEISWDSYNTVSQVHDYFKYKNTANQHQVDTVMVWGYVVGEDDANYFQSEYKSDNHILEFYFVDDPNARLHDFGSNKIISLLGDHDKMEWILDYRVGKRAFLKGTCFALDEVGDEDCNYFTFLNVISAFVE